MPNIQDSFPIISVIIVVYNGEKFVRGAIESVLGQDYVGIELIIIDGKSTDRTISIIDQFKNKIYKVVSEPDQGIYDAMNKGVKLSNGKWIYFLGSDDELVSETIISSIFRNNHYVLDGMSVIYGNVITNKGKVIQSTFSWKMLLHNSLHHQSAFYRRSLFDKFLYNENLRMISDYELNLKLYLSKAGAVKTGKTIAMCRDGGLSTNIDNIKNYIDETNLIRGIYIQGLWGSALKILFLIKAHVHNAIRYI